MRTLFATLCLGLSFLGSAQAPDYLEHNNIRVTLPKSGNFFYDENGPGGFEAPINSGNHSLNSAQFYFMGEDINGQLRASLGGPTSWGRDVFDGPFSNVYNFDSTYMATWEDQSWQICLEEIDIYTTWWEACTGPNQDPQACANAEVPSNATLTRLYAWPAHGNTSNGEDYWMAPFWDNDGDGWYHPDNGDYPIIKGCCATWRVENDAAGLHTMSNAEPLIVEMRYMTYQYRNFGLLNDVTFVELELINRGTSTYYDFVHGMQVDLATASSVNEYIGSDSTRSLFYSYYDNDTHPTLGQNPPILGVVALETPLTSVVDIAGLNNTQIWETMHGLRNGQAMVDNQGDTTKFIYDDNPNILGGWSQEQAGGQSEQRVLLSTEHNGVFAPGDRIKQTFAFVYMKNGTRLQSVDAMYAAADELHTFYDTISNASCQDGVLSIPSNNNDAFGVTLMPNPASGYIDIMNDIQGDFTVAIVDTRGSVIFSGSGEYQMTVDVSEFANGAYFVQIQSGNSIATEKLIINH